MCMCGESTCMHNYIPGWTNIYYVASLSLSYRFHSFIQFAIPCHLFRQPNLCMTGDSDRSRDDVVGIETFEFLFIYSASTNYNQLC